MRWTILQGRQAKGSDQEAIEWESTIVKPDEPHNVQVRGWNMVTMSNEDEAAADKLWKAMEGQRGHLD